MSIPVYWSDCLTILFIAYRRLSDPDRWKKGPANCDEPAYAPCCLKNALWRASNGLGLKATQGEWNTAVRDAERFVSEAVQKAHGEKISISAWEDLESTQHITVLYVLKMAMMRAEAQELEDGSAD